MTTESEDAKEESDLTEEEIFDQAWDEESEGAEESPSEENSEEQPQGQTEEPETAGAPQEESAAPESPEQDDPAQMQARIEQLRSENRAMEQRMRSWEGRIKAANKRAEEAEQKLKEAQELKDKAESLPEGEDDAVLSEFIEEFPTLEKPIKALIKKVAGSMVKTELDRVESRVKRVEDTQVEASAKSHAERINEAHPDWKQIYDSGKLNAWIGTQPSFVQRTLNQVVAEGTTEDIIEMFDQYKASLGQNNTTSSNTGRSKSARAAAMQAVPAKTGGPPKLPPKAAKDDFDAAWEEAISKG